MENIHTLPKSKWFYNNVHFIKIFLEQNVFLNYCNCWLWLLWLFLSGQYNLFFCLNMVLVEIQFMMALFFSWETPIVYSFRKKRKSKAIFLYFFKHYFWIISVEWACCTPSVCPAMFREISQSMCKVCKLHLISLPAFL